MGSGAFLFVKINSNSIPSFKKQQLLGFQNDLGGAQPFVHDANSSCPEQTPDVSQLKDVKSWTWWTELYFTLDIHWQLEPDKTYYQQFPGFCQNTPHTSPYQKIASLVLMWKNLIVPDPTMHSFWTAFLLWYSNQSTCVCKNDSARYLSSVFS